MAEGKLGRNEQAVLEALRQATGALSAYEILDALRGSSIRAPAQVYRALDKLAAQHLVHRIESMNKFVTCAHEEHNDGHDHASVAFCICEDCGDVAELPIIGELSAVDPAIKQAGFETHAVTFEVRGRCRDCKKFG